jgi:hypothetical protein
MCRGQDLAHHSLRLLHHPLEYYLFRSSQALSAAYVAVSFASNAWQSSRIIVVQGKHNIGDTG